MLISRFPNNNSREKIYDMEKEYNICISQQYKTFLCDYNGGETPNTTYKSEKMSTKIKGFYGFGDVTFSFDKINISYWLKNNILPIACDSFGNIITIGLTEENNGKIYFCDHEKAYKNKLIEKDFKSFIIKCISGEINPKAKRSIEERESDLILKGKGANITEDLRKMWQAEIDKYGKMVQETVIIK